MAGNIYSEKFDILPLILFSIEPTLIKEPVCRKSFPLYILSSSLPRKPTLAYKEINRRSCGTDGNAKIQAATWGRG